VTFLSFSGSPPLIDVRIAPSISHQQVQRLRGLPIRDRIVRLLVDTGSSHSAIDEDEVKPLGLHASGLAGVVTMSSGALNRAGLAPQYNTYRLSLLLTCSQPGRSFQIDNITITAPNQQPFAGTGHVGILGRDILDRGMLMYDGNGGHFALSF
jgi:hypothetical protein